MRNIILSILLEANLNEALRRRIEQMNQLLV